MRRRVQPVPPRVVLLTPATLLVPRGGPTLADHRALIPLPPTKLLVRGTYEGTDKDQPEFGEPASRSPDISARSRSADTRLYWRLSGRTMVWCPRPRCCPPVPGGPSRR